MNKASLVVFLALFLPIVDGAHAQPRPEVQLKNEQREAMMSFARMDGAWRGTAWTILPGGAKHEVIQTERIGTLLDGTIRLVEGRGYNADGSTAFNAFGVIAYDPQKKSYTLRSHAQGRYGEFSIKPTADGYVWEIPAGPMIIRYTATFKEGAFREIGERIVEGKEPARFFEMNLTRVSDSAWPGAGAIPPK